MLHPFVTTILGFEVMGIFATFIYSAVVPLMLLLPDSQDMLKSLWDTQGVCFCSCAMENLKLVQTGWQDMIAKSFTLYFST